MKWFRFYNEAVNDPKVQRLPGDTFKAWVNLLCLAADNDGYLPPIEDLAFSLRLPEEQITEILEELGARGLLDEFDGSFKPHNWNGRQYRSDVSTERVKRFRKQPRNVSVTPPEQIQIQIQKTDTEKKDSRAVAIATRPELEKAFEEFWGAYPKRDGASPKAPARKSFFAAVKRGVEPAEIIEGARRCATKESDKIGTKFIPQAVTWLNQSRWGDYTEQPETPAVHTGWKPGMRTREEIEAEIERVNGQANSGQGNGVRQAGARVHLQSVESPRQGDEGSDIPRDRARHKGMASLGTVLQGIPRLRAVGDETG
jgi:hypothetical protein